MLTQQCELSFCLPRDEYTSDRNYYKINRNLTEIPDDIPTDALKVYISYNNIVTVRANTFTQLVQCTELRLANNGISVVEPEAFNGLVAMKRLSLPYNMLERLYQGMFNGLENCISLQLDDNRISEVETGSLNALDQSDCSIAG